MKCLPIIICSLLCSLGICACNQYATSEVKSDYITLRTVVVTGVLSYAKQHGDIAPDIDALVRTGHLKPGHEAPDFHDYRIIRISSSEFILYLSPDQTDIDRDPETTTTIRTQLDNAGAVYLHGKIRDNKLHILSKREDTPQVITTTGYSL